MKVTHKYVYSYLRELGVSRLNFDRRNNLPYRVLELRIKVKDLNVPEKFSSTVPSAVNAIRQISLKKQTQQWISPLLPNSHQTAFPF